MALHCTECGFVNAEGANYCQRCGGLLARPESPGEPATATYRIDEAGELVPVELDDVTAHGPALVIRAGGGRVGESFAVDQERTSIGRRPAFFIYMLGAAVMVVVYSRLTDPMYLLVAGPVMV